jgi:hypothetical protein
MLRVDKAANLSTVDKFQSSVEAVEALTRQTGFMKQPLTAVLFIRSISTVWLSVTHVSVRDTLFPVSTRCGAQATLEAVGLESHSCYGRTAQLIRAVVAVSTTVTHRGPGDAAPPVLAPEVSYKVNSETSVYYKASPQLGCM